MQKITTTALLFFICFSLSAQYKKASFFGKEGRTYGLASQLHAMGDGKGSPIGYTVTFGRDKDGKQFFASWELEYIPSYKFSFGTTDYNGETVAISGQSKSHLVYGVNYGFYLLNNKVEDRKLKPFVSLGFNIVIAGGIKYFNNDVNSTDNAKYAPGSVFSTGLRGGLGLLYNFSPKFALKLDGGYTHQYNLSMNEEGVSDEYYMFTRHAAVSLGIRFRFVKED
jgi:hypothetical protein